MHVQMCRYCGKDFATKNSLKRHITTFHSTDLLRKFSIECSDNFAVLCFIPFFFFFYYFIENEDINDQLVIPEYLNMNCYNCPFVFKTYNEIRSHYLNVHNADMAHIKCCDRKFRSKSEIKQHIEWHESITNLR